MRTAEGTAIIQNQREPAKLGVSFSYCEYLKVQLSIFYSLLVEMTWNICSVLIWWDLLSVILYTTSSFQPVHLNRAAGFFMWCVHLLHSLISLSSKKSRSKHRLFSVSQNNPLSSLIRVDSQTNSLPAMNLTIR